MQSVKMLKFAPPAKGSATIQKKLLSLLTSIGLLGMDDEQQRARMSGCELEGRTYIRVIGVLDRGAVRGLQRRPRVGQSLYNISTDLITLEQVGWTGEGG